MALTPAYFETDNVTGQEIKLVGSGGPLVSNSAWLASRSAELAATGTRSIISAKSSVYLSGDSKMQYGYTAGNQGGTWSNSHVAWANDLFKMSGVGFDIVGSSASAGTGLAHIISTQLATALASGADIWWVHSGVNDFNPSGDNVAVATTLSRCAQILAAAAPYFKVIVWDSVDPVLQSGSTGAKGRAFQFRSYNAAVQALCNSYTNVIFNDTYAALVDSTNASNDTLANTVRADDGIHFLSNGAQKSGYASFSNIAPRLKLTRYKTEREVTLPAFSGSGGTATGGTFITVTGTPPVGWELLGVSGASANQAVTISELAPDMIRLVFTNNGIAGVTYLRCLIDATHNAELVSQISNGDLVAGSIGFQASGMSGVDRIATVFRVNASGTYLHYGMGQPTSTEGATIVYPQIAHGGRRGFEPYTVPVAVTGFEFIVAVKQQATSAGLTLDLYAPKLVVLT